MSYARARVLRMSGVRFVDNHHSKAQRLQRIEVTHAAQDFSVNHSLE